MSAVPSASGAPDDRRVLLGWLAYVCLMALVAWACFGSLRHHSVFFHDQETFRDNQLLLTQPGLFFAAEREQLDGRPVASLVKLLAFSVVGNRAGPAHLVVVAFHLLTSLLLAWAGRRLGLDRATSYLAGLLFLVNVAHYQSVHHISALDFPLALSLCLLAWVSDRHQRLHGGWWSAVTGAVLLAAMASHLSAMALCPLLVYDRWHGGVRLGPALWRVLPLTVAAALGALGLLAVTPEGTTTGESLRLATADPVGALLGCIRMVAWMLSRLVSTAHWLPLRLAGYSGVELALGAVTFLGLAFIVSRRALSLAPWAAWSLLFIGPFALIAESITVIGLEGPSHYLYPSSAGASVLLAGALTGAGTRLRQWQPAVGRIGLVAAILCLTISSWVSLKRVESLSWYNSGRFLLSADPQASVDYLRNAIASGEGVIPMQEAYLRLATSLPLLGQDPYPALREGVAHSPRNIYLLGAVAIREMESADPEVVVRGQERLTEAARAAAAAHQAERFGTNITALCHNMALAYERAGQLERAIRTYRHALELNPSPESTRKRMVAAYSRWSQDLARQGDSTRADSIRQLATPYQ